MKKFFQKELTRLSNYVWFIVIFIYMLILAGSTSPLLGSAASDSGIFMEVGKEVCNGKILFKEIFDHKGPLLFFINAIPQNFIHGTFGIWFTEFIFMFISIILIFKISKKFFKNTIVSIIPPISYMAFSAYTIQYGNMSEEYSNFFCIIALYIFINFYFSKKKKISNLSSIILGVTFMAVVMIRMNNSPTIVSTTIFIFFYLLLNKRFKEVIKYFLYYILGCIICIVPILSYFVYNKSLYDFFYGTFIFNFMYEGDSLLHNIKFLLFTTKSTFKIVLWVLILTSLLSVIISFVKKNLIMAVFLSLNIIITLVAICLSGHAFMHYLITGAPQFLLSIIVFLKELNLEKITPSIIFILIIFCTSTWITYFCIHRLYKVKTKTNNYIENSIELASNINCNKDEVFSYNQEARWFFLTDTSPCNRYFTLQDWWNLTDKNVYKEINSTLKNNKPTWIITSNPKKVSNKDLSKMKDKFIMQYLKKYYIQVSKNNSGILYKLK